MNLAEMLTYTDIAQLSKIANHYQCSCNGNSKNELIQSILHQIGRREFIEEHVSKLSAEDFRFLNTLLFDHRQHYSLEELMARAQHTRFTEDAKEKENPRDIITRFRQRGWLFNGSSQNTKFLFEVPEDLKLRFREVLGQRLKDEVRIGAEPSAIREEHNLAVEDLYLILYYISKNELLLNQEGIMYRRNQMQLMDSLHVNEPLVGKGGWRFGYGRTFKYYPDRLSLLYDYAYSQRLIEEKDFRLKLTSLGERFVLEEKRESLIHLVRFWLKTYKAAIPNLLSLMYWIYCCTQEWVTVTSLSQSMDRLIRPYYYDTSASIFEERTLKMMLHLGLIRVGEDKERERYVQITAYGKTVIPMLQNRSEEPV
ncbi:hypothetical protein [Paenibacillus sp. YPG26]|uniref:hypothetical protein n=1 Tax=Paenibacillus sp. YPG26 TaxID=2878915 RepID=UPI00203B35C4|nr:hypothetical protein [Paenibacillus sp. YPG26]USB34784.1 hypothetical protein LDO05_08555 [Paenibacillus sp. YPG26]